MGRTAAHSAPSQPGGTVRVLRPLAFAQNVMPQLTVQVPNRPAPQPNPYLDILSRPLRMDEIYQYFYPWNPWERPITVIGISTNGVSTSKKSWLPDVYEAAGVPMLCHSCLTPLSRDAVFIGDHQPATRIYQLLCNPAALYTGIVGRPGHIARYIASNQIPFPLYVFFWKNQEFQTNNYYIAQTLGRRTPIGVYYGNVAIGQYLYPHCWRCSYRQGDLLR